MTAIQNLDLGVKIAEEGGTPSFFFMTFVQDRGILLKQALDGVAELVEDVEYLEGLLAMQERIRWGRIGGNIEDQTDLQEELGLADHAMCGGM